MLVGKYEVEGVAEGKGRMYGSMKLGYILPVPPATAILTILLSPRVTLSSTVSIARKLAPSASSLIPQGPRHRPGNDGIGPNRDDSGKLHLPGVLLR